MTRTLSHSLAGCLAVALALFAVGGAPLPKDSGIPTNFLRDLIEDSSPQLGGNLDGQSYDLSTSGTLQTGNVTVGSGAAGVDYTQTFNGEDSDGVLTWDEDNALFSFDHRLDAPGLRLAQCFVGLDAGHANSSGQYNTYLGYNAGYHNDANSNTCLGYKAGEGKASNTYTQCVCVGQQAGAAMEDGADGNVFLGYRAGYANTSGEKNFFAGSGTGYANTTGSNNFFMGYGAGLSNVGGSGSIYIGRAAGSDSTSDYNVAIGYYASEEQSSGTNNVTLGRSAGEGTHGSAYSENTYLGSYAGRYTSTASDNVCVGYAAGLVLGTGSNNVILGPYAGMDETGSNTLIIDNQDRASQANGRIKALVYGQFAAATADQLLRINGAAEIRERLKLLSGNAMLPASAYLNWGATEGSAGYGLRDDSGTVQYKDSGGAWTAVSAGGGTDTLDDVCGRGATTEEAVGTGNLTIGSGAAGVDYTITFDGEDDDGNMVWDEDLSQFAFDNTVRSPFFFLPDDGGVGAANCKFIFDTTTDDITCDADLVVDGELSVDGPVVLQFQTGDPSEPANNTGIIWIADGAGAKGDDGDVCIAVNKDGTTKWDILFDHSAGSNW